MEIRVLCGNEADVMRALTLLRAAEDFFLCTQMNHSERGLEKYKYVCTCFTGSRPMSQFGPWNVEHCGASVSEQCSELAS